MIAIRFTVIVDDGHTVVDHDWAKLLRGTALKIIRTYGREGIGDQLVCKSFATVTIKLGCDISTELSTEHFQIARQLSDFCSVFGHSFCPLSIIIDCCGGRSLDQETKEEDEKE